MPSFATIRPGALRLFEDWLTLTRANKIEAAGLMLLLFGFPYAYYLERLLSLPSQVVTVPFRAAIACCLALTLIIATRYQRTSVNWAALTLGIFLVLYSVRLAVDLYIIQVYTAFPRILYVAFFLGMVCTSYVVFTSRRPQTLQSLSLVYRWGIHLSAGGCLLALYFSRGLLGSEFGRLRAEGGINPIALGHMGATLVILLSAHAIYARRAASTIANAGLSIWFYAAYYTLGITTIALASSRSPVLALLLCLTVLLTSSKNYRAWGVAGIGCALLYFFQDDLFEYVHRSGSSILLRIEQSIRDNETGSRLELWEIAMTSFSQNPILGASAFQEGSYPHNLVVEAFMATGLVGGTVFLLTLLYATIAGTILLRDDPALATTYVLFLQYLTLAMFSGSLWGSVSFWALLSIVIGAIPALREANRTRPARQMPNAPAYSMLDDGGALQSSTPLAAGQNEPR